MGNRRGVSSWEEGVSSPAIAQRLGVRVPDVASDVRTAQVCAPCDGDLDALHVAVAAIDGGRGRVCLKGVD